MNTTFYDHWREMPESVWRWPNFSPAEIACRGTGKTAILPLVPYLDTLRWVFIAVALGGIAVTIYARLDDWRRGLR